MMTTAIAAQDTGLETVLDDLSDALGQFWDRHMEYWRPDQFAAVAAVILGIDVT
jgi:hypothetical protein